MKAIVFARVSTQDQMRDGSSIPAQLTKMRDYCQYKNLVIKTEYQIDESSTRDERRKFEVVIEQIKASKEKTALIIETIDRLQRSFKESVVLDDLRKKDLVEIHFIREGLIISVNSNSSDLLRWDMGVMFARGFVLQLSDNVKRSIEEKLRRGEWPGKAQIGFKNVTFEDGKKTIVVDEFLSRVVIKAYELYATGAYSMQLLLKKLKDDHGISWSKGYLDQILKNPFYYGMMRMKGKLYPHKYLPLISKTLYDQVQQVKTGHNKKKFKYAGLPYIYRGVLRCGTCGLAITPEKHKGHVYYHCTEYNGSHGAAWVREEKITEQLRAFFSKLVIPEPILAEIKDGLRSVHLGKSEFREEETKKLVSEKEKFAIRSEQLYLDKLDGRITTQEYDKFYQSFRDKIAEIDSRLANLQEAEDNYYLMASYLLEVSQKAFEIFERSEVEEKRQLLSLSLSNLRLEGKTVQFIPVKPFDRIYAAANSQSWLPGKDSNLRFPGPEPGVLPLDDPAMLVNKILPDWWLFFDPNPQSSLTELFASGSNSFEGFFFAK